MPKKLGVKGAKKRAWTAMSLYIRLKHADNSGNVSCISCGATHDYRDIDAGHYIPKSRGNSVYFLEENVHPQCKTCNHTLQGNQHRYAEYLIGVYGTHIIAELEAAGWEKTRPWKVHDYLEIEAEYKQRLAELNHACG